MAAGTTPFALNPSTAVTGILNLTSSDSVKYHRQATSKLSEDLFDWFPEELYQFMRTLGDRANECQWNDNTGIMVIATDPAAKKSVARQPIDERWRDHAVSNRSIWGHLHNHPDSSGARLQHDFHCLMIPLSKAGKGKIIVWGYIYKMDLQMGTYS